MPSLCLHVHAPPHRVPHVAAVVGQPSQLSSWGEESGGRSLCLMPWDLGPASFQAPQIWDEHPGHRS